MANALTTSDFRSYTMFAHRIVLIVFPLVLAFGACISVAPRRGGVDIDPAFVQTIQKGTTTATALRARLGEPQTISKSSSGTESWTYTGWEGRPATFGAGYDRMRTRTLTLTIRDGVVVDYSYSTSQGR